MSYLTEKVCTLKHLVCCPPADLAVEGNDEHILDAAIILKPVEIADTLVGGLDLDGEGTNGSDDIETVPKDLVPW